MAEKIKMSRHKIPWLDSFIVTGDELRSLDDELRSLDDELRSLDSKIESIERQLKRQLFTSKLRLKMNTKLRDRLNVILGNVRAPECPKCGKPKKPGGIQWLDHAVCKRKKSI